MKTSFMLLFYLVLLLVVSCTTPYVGGDIQPSTGNAIASAANRYLVGSPEFFISPYVWEYSQANVIKNKTGAVGYTYGIQLGDPNNPRIETIEEYRKRLNNATVKDQTSYHQYIQQDDSGFPATVEVDNRYMAGYTCFVMVYRIYDDAGYNVTFDPIFYGCDRFLLDNNFTPIDASEVQVGDVVAYDLENDNVYDHMGIVSYIKNGETDYKDWYVISVFASAEFHEFGARENTIGAYEHISRGGVYSVWDDMWEEPTIEFFRK